MLEVSRVGVSESDDEIELSLELSIGGSYGKLKQGEDSIKEGEKGLESIVQRSGFSSFQETIFNGDQVDTESGSGSEVLESQRKREIQALRRQEARRKREEKLRKSSLCAVGVANAIYGNDKVWLEAHKSQARARDREIRENDAFLEVSAHKKKDEIGSQNGSKPSSVSILQNVPIMQQIQEPYTKKNGLVYPNVGKYYEKEENKGRNVFQGVVCGGFRPYPNGTRDLKLNDSCGNGCDSEHNINNDNNNSGKCGSGIKQVMSNGSLERSSSALSDYRSTSGKGGSSSETGSHSSSFQANEHVPATNDMMTVQPAEINSCSRKKESEQLPKETADKSRNGTLKVPGNVKAVVAPTSVPEEEPRTTNGGGGGGEGSLRTSLPRMPRVSTTGTGPNGKTITGFLYRYTKNEVSIVCVCHGTSFSPAEFVEHAGGTDITHPLRHITMVPSSFG